MNLICIPKTGDILILSIDRHRWLFGIGPFLFSSMSGFWFKHRRRYKLWGCM